VTDACLNLPGNLPSEKDRLAKRAIISEKTDWQRKTREVGITSGVAEIEHIDLTAVFTYRTMSYDVVRSVNTALFDDSKIHIV